MMRDEIKPFLDTRVDNHKVDGYSKLAHKDGAELVDANFGHIYPKADKLLYYKDDNQLEQVIITGPSAGAFIAVDADAYPNQKRSASAESDLSIGVNSNLTDVSTSETGGLASLGLVIGSETLTKLVQFASIKHQDANEQPIYALVRTRGDESTPTAVQADDNIGGVYGISHNGTGYEVNGILEFQAVNNQTPTNADARFVVRLTETNNVTTSEAFIFDQDSTLAMRETATPALKAGFGKIYVKSSDNGLYFLDSAGVEWPLGGSAVVDTLQETYLASNPASITLNAVNGGLKLDPNGVVSEPFEVVDNFVIRDGNGWSLFESGDDRDQADNAGNLSNIVKAVDIPLAGFVVLYSLDTTAFRTALVNNSFLITADISIYNKTANSSIAEYIKCACMATWRDDLSSLNVQPVNNIEYINGDYSQFPQFVINGNNLEIRLIADTVNEYHVCSNINVIINNVNRI